MTPRGKREIGQLDLLQVRTGTAPCVPALRKAVAEWKDVSYKGATETTKTLLRHWFERDHRPAGRPFRYDPSQREAMETLIYVYEAAEKRRVKDLLEEYAEYSGDIRLLQYDDFARYCVKMATGSGKTKVMALAAAWQYFNAVAEGRPDYARTCLLIAPNVIVFERLQQDFAGGRIFKADPIIPPELRVYWDYDVYVRGDTERAASQGALYLTNIDQLRDRPDRNNAEPEPMTDVMGPKPPANKVETVDFDERIAARGGPVLVINDEAHHTHDEKLKWNELIRDLHQSVPGGLAAQLDFTATPRHQRKGQLFAWTIFDYPLKQAMLDNIVKRPVKGITSGIEEGKSKIASVRYASYLTAGVERWREYRDQLKGLKKKPVLFVMLNDTSEADEVGDYLRHKYPEDFAGDKLLIIHTDTSGDISKKQLDVARKAAREIDRDNSPINAIVSVLMLREGWDVQNVTVVVGLRPYSAKANILPEQTIGRGLRLMFRGQGQGYVERVDVIGNRTFMDFVEDLERDEDIQLDTFEVGKDKLVIITIEPDPAKMDMDIALPKLSPILARKTSLPEEIAALDVAQFDCPIFPKARDDKAAQTFKYEGKDILTLETIVSRDYTIPEPQTAQEVIGYYAKRIAQEVKLPSQFAALVPKVREFLETRAFGDETDIETPGMVKAISTNVAQYVTVKAFVKALRALVVEELEPRLEDAGRSLSTTPPFPWSRPTREASKTVFNKVACDNDFEAEFAGFLQSAEDVERFAKLPQLFGFTIEYTDSRGSMRYYEPDFVVALTSGEQYIVETKGREDIDVRHKDRAAQIWCENASMLTGSDWRYMKIPQKEYEALQPVRFGDLLALGGLGF